MPSRQDFAKQLRGKYPTQTARYRDDNQLVDEWIKTHPQDKSQIESINDDSAKVDKEGFSPVAMGLRVVPAALTSVGGWPGAAGSAVGEGAAQIYEYLTQDKPFRPAQIPAQAAIGAIPFSGAKAAITPVKALLGQTAKGMALGGASSAITDIAEGQMPDPKKAALSAGLGGVFGGGTQALIKGGGSKVAKAATEAGGNVRPKTEVRAVKFMDKTSHIPMAEDIPTDRVLEFPSIQKMPKEVQGDIKKLLEEHGGFADQRRDVQPIARTKALAEQLTIPMRTLKKGTALNAEELVAYRDAVASIMEKRHPLAEKIASGKADDRDLISFSKLTDDATMLLASYRGAKSEAGRALNILRTKARIMELGDTKFMEALQRAPGFKENAAAQARATIEAGTDPIKQLEILKSSGTLYDKGMALYYNSLLSGVKTHLRNTIGNSFNMVANLAQPVFGAPMDMAISAATGKGREVFAGEVGQQLIGTWAALPQAMSRALFSMKHGFSLDKVDDIVAEGKFDTLRTELPGGIITNWPSRLLDASDQFFRTLARSQEQYAGAYAAAMKKGAKTPEQFKETMSKLLTSEDIMDKAETFSARAVFQEKAGPIIEPLLRMKSNPKIPAPARAAITFVVPFVRTPANILRQGMEATPMGFGMNAVRQGGRAGAQGVGRATGGSLLLAPIAWAAANGQLSGNGPTDPGERAALYESGWQPNSVKIGDKWVRYQLFQPLSVPMAAVANAYERFRQSDQSDKAAEESMLQALTGAGASIMDQSFLAGLNGFLDAMQDPERYAGNFLALTAQGMVPGSGMLRNVTQAVDPVVRKPEGAVEAVKSIIPGLSESVPPRRTRFGEEVKRPGGPIQRGFIVPEVSKEIKEPTAEMLKSRGIQPQIPRARLVSRGEKIPLTREQADVVEQAIGMERKRRLQGFIGRGSDRGAENTLSDVTRRINARAIRLVKAGQPVTMEALIPRQASSLTGPQVDRAYQEYLRRQGR